MKSKNQELPFLEVLSGGQTTSLQDLGRNGFQDKGVPPSGVINKNNMRLVNKLVGNNENEAVLETFISGPTLKMHGLSALVSIAGNYSSSLDIINKDIRVRSGRSIKIVKDDLIKINTGMDNLISTFSVSGGFKVPKILGSRSTNPSVKMGGFNGGFLEDGMRLYLNKTLSNSDEKIIPNYCPTSNVNTMRVILGPHEDKFDKFEIEKFLSTQWLITKDINRMGIKLSGEEIKSIAGRDMLSDGNQIGSIQITLKGEPIILLPDRGTIGGYPKIATLISPDLKLISSLKVGQNIKFKSIDIAEAQKISSVEKIEIDKMLSSIIKI